jgi:hypothetical protein
MQARVSEIVPATEEMRNHNLIFTRWLTKVGDKAESLLF